MDRRTALLVLLAAGATAALPGGSHADVLPFDARAFADAQAAGKGIVVFVHAPW